MEITLNQNEAKVTFPFDAEVVAKVNRSGLGMKWSAKRKEWTHPITYNFVSSFLREFPEERDSFHDYILPKSAAPISTPEYLMAHQKAGVINAQEHPRRAFFWDTGVGKTLLAIEIIKQKNLKTLVVCPLSIIETAWMEDLQKFAPEIYAINLWEYRQAKGKKKALLKKQADVAQVGIVNFESFKLMEDELYSMEYEMLIVDESSKAKDPKSQITKKLTEYADRTPYVYLLSGTPAPNSPLEYYSQVRMIDQGLMGASYYSFRKKYAYQTGYGGFKWTMKKDIEPEFIQKLRSVSEVIKKKDVLDLPERTHNKREVTLSKEEMSAYNEMKDNLIIELENGKITAANAAVKIGKLRQGSSGFYYDVTGNAVQVGKSKLNELKELLEEIGKNQVIIWTQFRHEADQITTELKGNAVRSDGSISQKEKTVNINLFKSGQGQAQYMVAHPKSLGMGQTLINCSYAIYYSLSHSLELQTQSEDRIYRKGQTNRCTYYYLLAKNTVDHSILYALHTKGDVSEAMLNHIQKGV